MPGPHNETERIYYDEIADLTHERDALLARVEWLQAELGRRILDRMHDDTDASFSAELDPFAREDAIKIYARARVELRAMPRNAAREPDAAWLRACRHRIGDEPDGPERKGKP